MLPKELLVTRKYKPNIWVKYVLEGKSNKIKTKRLAKELISLFENGTGKTYRELKDQASELETFKDFKLVRGLFTLLERRCTFRRRTSLDPKGLRSALFLKGPATSAEERKKILREVAKGLEASVKDIKRSFWSDKEEEKILKTFDPIRPVELLKQYNLSLTQTLLFNAVELNFKASGNYQEIFRAIKYHGLMYFLEKDKGKRYEYKIHLSGPASIFRKTRRYGTSLAKITPSILEADRWEINAKIETKVGGEKRVYDFSINDSKRRILKTKRKGIKPKSERKFDSLTEESFAKRLKALRGDWKVKREPTIFKAGRYVFIPDFSFEKGDLVHYLEVVGFWTDKYIRKKIEKVRKVELPKNVKMTIAVNKDLRCTRGDFKRVKRESKREGEEEEDINVIFYDREIPVGPVIRILDKMDLEKRSKEKEKIKDKEIDEEIIKDLRKSKQKVVSLGSIAKKYKVGVRSLKEVLKERLKEDKGKEREKGKEKQFILTGRKIVSRTLLNSLKDEIDLLQDKTLANVQDILDQYNLSSEVLENIGYRVKFDSLDPSEVKVVRKW